MVVVISLAFLIAIVVLRSFWAWALEAVGTGFVVLSPLWGSTPTIESYAFSVVFLCLLLSPNAGMGAASAQAASSTPPLEAQPIRPLPGRALLMTIGAIASSAAPPVR